MNMTYYMPELVAPGKRVLSYPDHLFNVRTGTIVEADDNYLQVEYEGYGRCSIRRRSGRPTTNSRIGTLCATIRRKISKRLCR